MRGGLAAPLALAAGLILSLVPGAGPPSSLRHPPEPQARPGTIPPVQSVSADAVYAQTATSTGESTGIEHAPAPSTRFAARSLDAVRPESLDVLFVGAHPDDESGDLSTFGQWNEQRHIRTGVLTITRGEGGGNAVGTEEGPALGLLREAEERKAVGLAGIHDIAYLDKVDFYYTVSDRLTRGVWDHDSTLAKVVRLVRETRPKVITTMTPSPIPGQHGNHQEAGRLAVEAYYLAADPSAFPSQLTKEHLKPWRAGRLLHQEHLVKSDTGPACETTFTPTDPTADVYGVWAGRKAHDGRTWAQVEAEASRFYASQGWAHEPDAPSDPDEIGCDYLTQVDSRVPFTRGDHDPAAALEGAVYPAAGGLPLGTEFYLTTSAFSVSPGEPFTVTAHAPSGRVALSVPAGWEVTGSGDVRHDRAEFAVTAPATSRGRVRLGATLTTRHGTGTTGRAVEVEPAVTGVQEPLPRVSDFDSWASSTGVPQLSGRVKRVLTLASGGSRTVRVDLHDTTGEAHQGTVTLNLPEGFTADEASKPYALAAGAHGSVSFTVRDTDTSLPTSNDGGSKGDYDYTISTSVQGGSTSTSDAALELVPATTISQDGKAPDVDGKESPGEYPGSELNLSRRWEGSACESAEDCSATGKVTWYDDALYVIVRVKDDEQGSALDAADCKRHWRTDSVEIGLDPRGDAENTSTTFKTGILPVTAGDGPCFERDADNHQGPGAETAPGMSVASSVSSSPYTGYTVETKIPLADLPAAVDPSRLALNIFVYDSDTDDKTGQTRIGWSTWGGVQGDPYRWGLATLPGYTPPPGRPTTPPPPVMPSTAALSVDSPQSIIQAASAGVPLAAGAAASVPVDLVGRPVVTDGSVTFRLRTGGAGTVHAYVWDDKVVGRAKVTVSAGTTTITVPGTSGTLAVAFEDAEGGTASIATGLG